jgi:protein-S-isoprenylcysteine O-methyltransferase Ste14
MADESAIREINMAYIDEMKKQGNWFFRRRSLAPLMLLVLLPFVLRDSSYFMGSPFFDRLWELFCFSISLFGLGLRIFTVGYVADGTSGRSTSAPKATELNTTGMYSIVRHPLYLSNYFIWMGIALFPHSVLSAVSCTLAFILYYERIIVAEETFLNEKFKAAFMTWASKTPAMIPNFKLWKRPSNSFCWRTVMKREYPGLLTITASFAIFDALIDLFRDGTWQPDWLWVIILCAGLLVFIVFRTLRKLQITDAAEKQINKQLPQSQQTVFVNSTGIN